MDKPLGINNYFADGSTALHKAVIYGNYKDAKYLIKNGADVNSQMRDGGITPWDMVKENVHFSFWITKQI